VSLKRRILARAAPVLDVLMAPSVYLAAQQLLLVRKITPGRAPHCMRALDRVGVYPLIDHYYEPMISLRHLRRPMTAERPLAGIELNVEAALALVEELRAGVGELFATPSVEYDLDNTLFGPLDAGILHAMIRRFRPRRIVEVGCGMSTLAALAAEERNRADDENYRCEHVCIEPYEQPWLERLPVRVERRRMEECDVALAESLGAGDILFIDSSHMIRPQGDVVTAVLEWLGRLRPGVLVHFHDIFTPRDYPEELMRVHRFFWNEQYLVEAFVAFNAAFRVMLPVNHLYEAFPERMRALCPAQTAERVVPASFWLRRVEGEGHCPLEPR